VRCSVSSVVRSPELRVSRGSVLFLIALAGTAAADPQARLAQQLAEERDAIDRAIAQVDEKLVAVDAARTRRLAAAYRLLRAEAGEDRMSTARRRAAARLLIDRDLAERGLLAGEVNLLRDAARRTTADAERVPQIELPVDLARPARGTIARRFGTIEHERSKTVLARRGIDLEVEARTAVVAPAAGVVRYAGPIRGLESGVIIDHGSYLSVLGKLGEIAVPLGATVERGDRVGRAARHRVYLEIRVEIGPGGLPIDPEPLFESR
jgi:septal ring factor EnvC (AmiA/AmiB activator)